MQKSKECKVFAADGGFRVVRQTSREQATIQEQMGLLRAEFDQVSGALIGFRIVGVELRKMDLELRSVRTDTAISVREMELNCARSRTLGMPELRRLERVKNGELPEDEVERVQAKVRVYAVIGSARGDILRVWPR